MYLGVFEQKFVIKLDSKNWKSSETEFLQTFILAKALNILSLTPSFESSRVSSFEFFELFYFESSYALA